MSFFGLFFVLLGQSALSKGAVCFLAMWQVLLNSCGGLAVAQLKEGGTELRSYAGGHIQTHACTQTLACTHTAAVMMCRPEVLEIKKKLEKEITGVHREADIFSDWCPVIFQTWQLRSAHLSVCARVCVFVHLSATCAFVNTVSVFFFNIWVIHGGSDSYTLAGW